MIIAIVKYVILFFLLVFCPVTVTSHNLASYFEPLFTI